MLMELYIGCFIGACILLIRAYIFKTQYIETYAICLDFTNANYPLYQYEMNVNDHKIIFENYGHSFLWAKKGRRYKVLVSRKDYDKVVAYNEYVGELFIGIWILIVVCFGYMWEFILK